MLKKNNREFRNKQTSNQRCLQGREWTLIWGSEKSMLPSMNCKLIFKTTTGSICPKGWKPTWEGILFRNASCLCSYLCLESCLRLTQSELRSDCTASVITERVIDTALKAEIRHSGIVKVFTHWGVFSETDVPWLYLVLKWQTLCPREDWIHRGHETNTQKLTPYLCLFLQRQYEPWSGNCAQSSWGMRLRSGIPQ